MFEEEVKKEVKKNKAVSDLFFKDVIEEVYKRYNISKSLKCYMFTGHEFGKRLNSFKFDKINFEHMAKGSEESKYETTDANNSTLIEKFRTDGIVDKKAYKIVSVRIFDEYFFFVFTNNLKKFEEEFFKIKIIQKNGLYKIEHSSCGSYLIKVSMRAVDVPIFNEDLFEGLTTEIKNFMKVENIYKKFKLDYKRGILLYGLPGNGKTCFIKNLLYSFDAISIICDAKKEKDLNFVGDFLNDKNIRDCLKIIVLEDIDGIDSYVRSKFLNLIDGVTTLNKVLFIDTSNDPKNLDHALTNRPSRFDSLYEIESPNTKTRLDLFKRFFPKESAEHLNIAIEKTKGFRGAHFKEIFLISKLYECSFLEAVEKLNVKFKDFKEYTNQNYLG